MKLTFVLWLQLPHSWYHALQPGAILGTSLQCLETGRTQEIHLQNPLFHRKPTLGDGMHLLDLEGLSTLEMRLLCIALSVKESIEVHHDATRSDYVSYKLKYISHKDCIFSE